MALLGGRVGEGKMALLAEVLRLGGGGEADGMIWTGGGCARATGSGLTGSGLTGSVFASALGVSNLQEGVQLPGRLIFHSSSSPASRPWLSAKASSTIMSRRWRVGSMPRSAKKRFAERGNDSTPGASTIMTLLCSSLPRSASKPKRKKDRSCSACSAIGADLRFSSAPLRRRSTNITIVAQRFAEPSESNGTERAATRVPAATLTRVAITKKYTTCSVDVSKFASG
mmetsp:Transcript_32467/g.80769  ORF Transcript_32467/g.80769 Transcript_32467/m.80769 type:complete len:227 (-) Transcript_32467:3955-4635(-)